MTQIGRRRRRHSIIAFNSIQGKIHCLCIIVILHVDLNCQGEGKLYWCNRSGCRGNAFSIFSIDSSHLLDSHSGIGLVPGGSGIVFVHSNWLLTGVTWTASETRSSLNRSRWRSRIFFHQNFKFLPAPASRVNKKMWHANATCLQILFFLEINFLRIYTYILKDSAVIRITWIMTEAIELQQQHALRLRNNVSL